jgi:hypothetical protein
MIFFFFAQTKKAHGSVVCLPLALRKMKLPNTLSSLLTEDDGGELVVELHTSIFPILV